MSSVLECSPLFSFVGVRNGGAPFHDSKQELTARVPGLLTIWEDHFSGKETVWSFFFYESTQEVSVLGTCLPVSGRNHLGVSKVFRFGPRKQ